MDRIFEIGYLFLLILLSFYGVYRYCLIWLYFKFKQNKPLPRSKLKVLPKVTVQIPVYNERYVVERVIRTACELDYPQELLEVHVLDDSSDDTPDIVEKTLREYSNTGIGLMHIRRSDRHDFKAGALSCGMKHAKGELIAIFDADFVVPKDFLRRSVHYFSDEKIGIVQARWGHMNSDYSFLTRLQSILLDGHFAIEQPARNRSGRFFNFNGTAGIWRCEAITSSGGWQAQTLAEDLDMSYRAQLAGWKGVYLNDLAVPAELPVEVTAFKNQQYRWAKGSIQVARKLLYKVLTSRLPLKVKIESVFHLGGFFTYLVGFFASLGLPMILMGTFNIPHRWYVDIIWFLLLALPGTFFYLCGQRELYPDWNKRLWVSLLAVGVGVALSANNALAVIDGFFGKKSEFVRTSKFGIKSKSDLWVKKAYKSRLTATAIFELITAAYFAFGCVIAIRHGLFLALPTMVLMFAGFAYLGGMSVWQNSLLGSLIKQLCEYRRKPIPELEV